MASKLATSVMTVRSTNRGLAVVRIIFGLVWAVDAAFKFEPAFYNGILETTKAADGGEPGWLNHWFNSWYSIIGSNPHLWAIIVTVIEVLIALSLLLGIARRLNYLAGAVFSFLIWSVGEGFGGPYVAGSTDIGAGFIYVVVFLLLYATDVGSPSLSLDPYLSSRFSWWHVVTDFKVSLPKQLGRAKH